MAVSVTWGSFKGSSRSPDQGFAVHLRQVRSRYRQKSVMAVSTKKMGGPFCGCP